MTKVIAGHPETLAGLDSPPSPCSAPCRQCKYRSECPDYVEINVGDLITIDTPQLRLCNLIVDSATNYGNMLDGDNWFIECHVVRGDQIYPHYWKQYCDGGTVTIQEEVIN